MEQIYYHIDINSAFLSWEAVNRVKIQGDSLDLRDIPSVIGGSQATRHGIVLAKSIPAKKYGISTGEPLVDAKAKCPTLFIASPNFSLYIEASRAFIAFLREYCPYVEQYSIDEAFCDMTGTKWIYGGPVLFAHELKDMIHDTFGFTVNIGVSSNKLLAKMASDFKKPDMVHSLFPNEIEKKMWPLPVSDLFYVGHSTERALHNLGIRTIGELAHTDRQILLHNFKSFGDVLLLHARGEGLAIDTENTPVNKGYGNSMTTRSDVTDSDLAKLFLLSLTETVGSRLRADHVKIQVIAVSITDCDFNRSSRQLTLSTPTDVNEIIYENVCRLFDALWLGDPIRQLGVRTSHARQESFNQISLFDYNRIERLKLWNRTIDSIRLRYGDDSVMRACFLNSPARNMEGGQGGRKSGITGTEI